MFEASSGFRLTQVPRRTSAGLRRGHEVPPKLLPLDSPDEGLYAPNRAGRQAFLVQQLTSLEMEEDGDIEEHFGIPTEL